MANYQSRYTGPEIDERLRKAGEAVLTEAQSLDAGKQAQARTNIGAGTYSKPQGGIPNSDLEGKFAGSPSAGGPAFKALGIPYGAVDAGSTDTNIKATVDNFPETLTDGVCAYIRNDVVASASGWTLNINNTGALPVYASNADATRVTTIFSAATTYLFVYNSTRVAGGCWDIYYGYNANDNTIGYNLRTNTMSLPVTSACYRYRLLFTSADGTKFVPANASTSTNATSARTTTQTPIDPFGTIRYYSNTTAVSSGNRPGVTYLWEQYSVTLGYSFNRTGAALTLTSWKPVYIKCAPQSDGSAIIDADNPYVQELPSTEDGKIYIYLGVATSATQVEVTYYHPVFYFKDGAIRLWTNAAATSNGVQDVTVGGTSVVTEGVAEIPAIPDISNCVQKSQTAGLLKNDGTVDTTAYGTYSKPQNGIPSSDMNADVQAALALAATSIQSLADYYDKEQVDAMLASVGSAYGVTAASLPTASAETLGKVYYIGPSNGEYTRYITTFDGTNYDWLSLGSTAMDLTDYATKEEVSELDQKIDDLFPEVEEDGFFVVDEGGNIAACITPTVNSGWSGVFQQASNQEYNV